MTLRGPSQGRHAINPQRARCPAAQPLISLPRGLETQPPRAPTAPFALAPEDATAPGHAVAPPLLCWPLGAGVSCVDARRAPADGSQHPTHGRPQIRSGPGCYIWGSYWPGPANVGLWMHHGGTAAKCRLSASSRTCRAPSPPPRDTCQYWFSRWPIRYIPPLSPRRGPATGHVQTRQIARRCCICSTAGREGKYGHGGVITDGTTRRL